MSLKLFFFAFKNKDRLEREYRIHTSDHEDNHYGTFEQFKELVKIISTKPGFTSAVARNEFVLKSNKGNELQFTVSSSAPRYCRVIVTTEWKKKHVDEKELVWEIAPDGTRILVPSDKEKMIRVFEYFVFASMEDYIRFRFWMVNVSENETVIKATEEEKVLLKKKQRDINSDYWLMTAENKKIFNMKEEEVDKMLELDVFDKEFKKLGKVDRDQKLLSGGGKNA